VAVPTEAEERRLVIRFARQWALRYPELDGLIAIHQELKFARAAATNSFTFYRSLLEQGYRPGIPDLVLPVAHWTFHGLWIELKRVRGSSVSREQRWWHEKLRGFGHLVVVAKGARPAIEWLLWYVGAEGAAAPGELDGGGESDERTSHGMGVESLAVSRRGAPGASRHRGRDLGSARGPVLDVGPATGEEGPHLPLDVSGRTPPARSRRLRRHR